MRVKRVFGAEQPYLRLGKNGLFKLRLPIIHYKLSAVDAVSGLANTVCCLAGLATLTSVLGLSGEQAMAALMLSVIGYLLHSLFGDATVPGWITPALAVIVVYLEKFDMGVERMQAMAAVEIELALLFIVLGFTGLAKKLNNLIPASLRCGIILGAAVNATFSKMGTGGAFFTYPVSIFCASVAMFFLLFNIKFREKINNNKIYNIIGSNTFIVAIVVTLIVGVMMGEIDLSSVSFSQLLFVPDFMGAFKAMSPFFIGWPGIEVWFGSIPIAFIAWVIAFGDFVTIKQLGMDARREDEFIEFNTNRTNAISGIRNLIQGLLCPLPLLCGPLSAPYTTSTFLRYKSDGRKGMDSIYSGMGTNVIFQLLGCFIMPLYLVSLACSDAVLTVLVILQGYVCSTIAFNLAGDNLDRGIAGIMAGVMVAQGGAWCIGAGLIFYFILAGKDKIKADYKLNCENTAAEDARLAAAEAVLRNETKID
ncbi:MAG: hypothetical protein LIO57_07365 [Oscillospiraceae bacterium]|nr:hypothetical protein [Oscillospiraceae bacterium]